VEPLTAAAYRFAEQLEAEKPRQGHQHDAPWHVSFHGSSFPGDYERACPRQALYTMMDISRGAFSRRSRQRMDAGKDLERQLVRRWWQAGMLLSAPPDAEQQTQFEDPEHWLTCTVDAILVKPRSVRPFVAEVKNIDCDTLDEMLRLIRGPHEDYVRQVKTEIAMAHEYGPWAVVRCINSGRLAIKMELADVVMNGERANVGSREVMMCPEHGGDKCLEAVTLPPVEYGYLYYTSRNDPDITREFYFEYDPRFMEEGRKRLAIWRGYWEQGLLPQTKFEGKHPFGWNWTTDDSPCKWCGYGPAGSYVCREDHQEAVKRGETLPLAESLAVEEARASRPEYDLDLVRAAVAARWGADRLHS
jgi:hypothetical protein